MATGERRTDFDEVVLNKGFRAFYVSSHNGAQDVVLVAVCRLTDGQLLSRVTTHALPRLQECCCFFWRTFASETGILSGALVGSKTKEMHLRRNACRS